MNRLAPSWGLSTFYTITPEKPGPSANLLHRRLKPVLSLRPLDERSPSKRLSADRQISVAVEFAVFGLPVLTDVRKRTVMNFTH